MEVKIHLTVSRTGLKQLMNQQIERYNKDVIYFDLYFDEDKLYAKVDSSSNEAPIKYKDLKKTLYLIFDYPYKYYTFKHFEV